MVPRPLAAARAIRSLTCADVALLLMGESLGALHIARQS